MGRGALKVEGDINSLWLRNGLSEAELALLDRIADSVGQAGGRVDWTSPQLASAFDPVTAMIRAQALPDAVLTRVVWFNKDAQSNWGVPWHQDRVIAVFARHDVPGFKNWSLKRGTWHCEPPVDVFQNMRFVRLHLDPCGPENGAMEIARGSQAAGVVTEAKAATIAAEFPPDICLADRGDIQVLPMLVLHRSRPSETYASRRALRLDYAATGLPHPLRWSAA